MDHLRKMLCLVVGAALLSACSLNYTTAVDSRTGQQRVYVMNQDEALAVAHGTIVRSFPGRRIETIDGPTRGYSTYTRMMLDTFTQQIVVRPVAGQTQQGGTVNGYVFEISGNGTSGSGALQNGAFFEALQREPRGVWPWRRCCEHEPSRGDDHVDHQTRFNHYHRI